MIPPKIEYVTISTAKGTVQCWLIPYKEGDRLALCAQCGRLSRSDERLPFFKWNPKGPQDSYFCGCCGWD